MEITLKMVFTPAEEELVKTMLEPINTDTLSKRTVKFLNDNNLKVVGSLCRHNKRIFLYCMRGCGKKTLEEIELYLTMQDLSIGMDLPEMVEDAIFFHERGNIYQRRQVK